MGQTVVGGVEQRTAAEVVQHGRAVSAPYPGDLGQRRLFGKADDAEVAAVHDEQRGRVLRDGALVVACVGAVDRPHLDQPRAALGENVGYPKASANLAGLAP